MGALLADRGQTVPADFHAVGTSGVELTSLGQVGWIRHQPSNGIQAFGIPCHAGNGAEQALGVGMVSLPREYILNGCLLYTSLRLMQLLFLSPVSDPLSEGLRLR